VQEREHIKAMRAEFRGFGAGDWKKMRRENSALQLTPEAYSLIETNLQESERERFKPRGVSQNAQRARRSEKRNKANAYTVRLDEATHRRVQAAMLRHGVCSNQTLIESLLLSWLEDVERAEGTEDNGQGERLKESRKGNGASA